MFSEIGENSLKFEFVAKPIDDETLLVLKNLVYFEDEEGFIVCTGAYLSSGYIITLNECNFESDLEIIAVLGAANKESPPLEFRFSLKAKYLPFVKIEVNSSYKVLLTSNRHNFNLTLIMNCNLINSEFNFFEDISFLLTRNY